jgi:hypothetical protein
MVKGADPVALQDSVAGRSEDAGIIGNCDPNIALFQCACVVYAIANH